MASRRKLASTGSNTDSTADTLALPHSMLTAVLAHVAQLCTNTHTLNESMRNACGFGMINGRS